MQNKPQGFRYCGATIEKEADQMVEIEYASRGTAAVEENAMGANTVSLDIRTRTEDILSHLPASSITPYPKGQTIYGPDHVSKNIYLVLAGNVGISHIAENGREVLLEIVRPEELFGESALLEAP